MASKFRIKSPPPDEGSPARSVGELVRSLAGRVTDGCDSEISSDAEEEAGPGPAAAAAAAAVAADFPAVPASPKTPVVPPSSQHTRTSQSAQRSFLSNVCTPSLTSRAGAPAQRQSTHSKSKHAEGSLQALLGQKQPRQQLLAHESGPAAMAVAVTVKDIVRHASVWLVVCDSDCTSGQLPARIHLLLKSQLAESLMCTLDQSLSIVPPWEQFSVGSNTVILPWAVGSASVEA